MNSTFGDILLPQEALPAKIVEPLNFFANDSRISSALYAITSLYYNSDSYKITGPLNVKKKELIHLLRKVNS